MGQAWDRNPVLLSHEPPWDTRVMGYVPPMNTNTGPDLAPVPAPARCTIHPAFELDYCPVCGTAVVIGGTR